MRTSYALWVVLLVVALVAGACGGSSGSEASSGASALSQDYDDALSIADQLAAGTMALDGTDLAVDIESAEALLPLWQAYVALAGSDTAADAELEAMLKQIQSAMTDEQIRAIADMKLTTDSAREAMGAAGLQFGMGAFAPGGEDAGDAAEARAAMSGGAEGQMLRPEGNAGAFGGNAEAATSPEAMQTAAAERGISGTRAGGTYSRFVVTFLQQKTGVMPDTPMRVNSTPEPTN